MWSAFNPCHRLPIDYNHESAESYKPPPTDIRQGYMLVSLCNGKFVVCWLTRVQNSQKVGKIWFLIC